MDTDDEEYKELQSFLELEEEEMKEITVSKTIQNKGKKEELWIGKGNAARGCKSDYDTYDASNAFSKVMSTSNIL